MRLLFNEEQRFLDLLGEFLRTYLHSDLRQADFQRQLLSAVHVGVVGLLKRPLQFVQLESGERGPVPTVFLLGVVVVGQFSVSVR